MTTYHVAYDALRAKLAALDLDRIVANSGARRIGPDRLALRCLGREYEVTYPGGTVRDADGAETPEHDAILLLLYLTEATGRPLEERWVAFEQLVGGAGYIGSFRSRVVLPVLRAFGQRPAAVQASHCSKVTSNFDTAKGLANLTLCCGFSSLCPLSDWGEPITNSPTAITTISGQVGQSRSVFCCACAGSQKAALARTPRQARAVRWNVVAISVFPPCARHATGGPCGRD